MCILVLFIQCLKQTSQSRNELCHRCCSRKQIYHLFTWPLGLSPTTLLKKLCRRRRRGLWWWRRRGLGTGFWCYWIWSRLWGTSEWEQEMSKWFTNKGKTALPGSFMDSYQLSWFWCHWMWSRLRQWQRVEQRKNHFNHNHSKMSKKDYTYLNRRKRSWAGTRWRLVRY